jgi:hypothetical protein
MFFHLTPKRDAGFKLQTKANKQSERDFSPSFYSVIPQ